MIENPKFSIIIPVYGVEKYIARCTRSLFKQSYTNTEFIFVNDGTKDNSIGIVEQLLNEEFPHLKDKVKIINKENEGLPAARKTGLEHADGDYILHVDSDDWVETDLVEKVAETATKTNADCIYFDFYKEYAHRSKKDIEKEYTVETKDKFVAGLFNYKAYGYVWNKCFKRSIYLENPVVFPKYGMHEDIFLASQLLTFSTSICHLRKALYHYRKDSAGSISSAKRKNRRRDSAMNMMDLFRLYKDAEAMSPVKDAKGEIIYRTAWLSMRYNFGFFKTYPEIIPYIKSHNPSFKNKTFIIWQWIVKLRVMMCDSVIGGK